MQLTTNCRTCGLFQYVTSPQVLGRGNITCPKIIMIGEAPGADEDKIGKPFMGRAGKMLDKMIKNYADVTYLTNAVKCFPPACKTNLSKGFRTPKESEIQLCKPFLIQELQKFSINTLPILMPLGNIALTSLVGQHKGITKELGIPRKVKIALREYTIIPNYHPSYICRNPAMESEFMRVLGTVWMQRTIQ